MADRTATPITMRLYNTLTRSEETFAPSVDNTVRMYTCGLTTYARGHIGNFRTFICLDVLRRTLKYLGVYRVKHPNLVPLHAKAKTLTRAFKRFAIRHTLRAGNKDADRLANLALDRVDIRADGRWEERHAAS